MLCKRALLLPLVALLHLLITIGTAMEPHFTVPMVNMTVPLGRDVTIQCFVDHLGGYRVGWVRADTKAIQAIQEHIITHNQRISVSHPDHLTWNLHIRSVQEEDRGQYMCQINTDPMKSQLSYLDVVIHPDFILEKTSGDVMVLEGGLVKLMCRSKGHPKPTVQWRREDGEDIIIRNSSGLRTRVSSYQGELLQLVKVSRAEMGAYMCIASNGVPPSVSKRVMLNINFSPVIQVPNQLVGAPLFTDVIIVCYVEASPKAITYWIRDTGEMVVSSQKYNVHTLTKSMFEIKMFLTVRDMQREDLGSYRCIAKNSLGEVEGNVRLYEIPGPTRISVHDDEDYSQITGSADDDHENNIHRMKHGDSVESENIIFPENNSASNEHRPIDSSASSNAAEVLHTKILLALWIHYVFM